MPNEHSNTPSPGQRPQTIPLSQIHDLPGVFNPKPVESKLGSMILSIQNNGVMEPVILRDRGDGQYQLLSGYRRRVASERAGKKDIPAFVYEMTMQEAIAYRKAVKDNPKAPIPGKLVDPAEKSKDAEKPVAPGGKDKPAQDKGKPDQPSAADKGKDGEKSAETVKSAEGVYDRICEDVRFYTKLDPKDIVFGDAGFWSNTRGSELDAFYRSAISRGLEYHERQYGRGLLPAALTEEVRALSRPPIRWDVELARWFDAYFAPLEKRRSYARMSRRQSATPDIPRPAWRAEEQAEAQRTYGVLLDTSGSMDRHLLAAALGSIAAYSEARDVKHIRVVFCDAAPYDQGIMHPDEIAGSVKIRGRGGQGDLYGPDRLQRPDHRPGHQYVLPVSAGLRRGRQSGLRFLCRPESRGGGQRVSQH